MCIRSGAVWTRRNWIRSGFDPDRMCSVEGPLVGEIKTGIKRMRHLVPGSDIPEIPDAHVSCACGRV